MTEGITSDINLYDSERRNIATKVLPALNAAVKTRRNYGRFAKEVSERFEEIGLIAHVVSWQPYTTADGGMAYGPEISIVGRVEDEVEHDHDRHRHEVRNNILGVSQPDVALSKPVAMPGTPSKLWTPGSPR